MELLLLKLEEQDEELIYAPSCQLLPFDMEPRNERLSGQLTHYTQQKGVQYDFVPEVHAYARIIEKNLT